MARLGSRNVCCLLHLHENRGRPSLPCKHNNRIVMHRRVPLTKRPHYFGDEFATIAENTDDHAFLEYTFVCRPRGVLTTSRFFPVVLFCFFFFLLGLCLFRFEPESVPKSGYYVSGRVVGFVCKSDRENRKE